MNIKIGDEVRCGNLIYIIEKINTQNKTLEANLFTTYHGDPIDLTKELTYTESIIEVIKAHKDGKEIEISETGTDIWTLCKNPLWNWVNFKYRIKSDTPISSKLIFYFNIYTNSNGKFYVGSTYYDKKEALENKDQTSNYIRTVKMIEVDE